MSEKEYMLTEFDNKILSKFNELCDSLAKDFRETNLTFDQEAQLFIHKVRCYSQGFDAWVKAENIPLKDGFFQKLWVHRYGSILGKYEKWLAN